MSCSFSLYFLAASVTCFSNPEKTPLIPLEILRVCMDGIFFTRNSSAESAKFNMSLRLALVLYQYLPNPSVPGKVRQNSGIMKFTRAVR